MAVEQDVTLVAQDTDIQGAGMQVDPAVKWMLMGVGSHEVSSFVVNLFSTTSIPPGYAEGEASYMIMALERTSHTAGFFLRRALVGCGPPLSLGDRRLKE